MERSGQKPEPKDSELISPVNSGLYHRLIIDYLDRSPRLNDLYKYQPDPASYKKSISEKQFSLEQRELLHASLISQYHETGIKLSGKVAENIRSFLSSNTFSVTTGHQLNIFTGPLYTLYKILSTIRLAEDLNSQYPDQHFVPVFWMAAEDHDFAEINHFSLFGKKLEWTDEASGGPVGRLSTSGLADVLDELSQLLTPDDNGNELLNLFRQAYDGRSLADATRFIFHTLFEKYGLVILNGDDVQLKRSFSNYMLQDMLDSRNFHAVNSTIKNFPSDYKIQVNPREINVFYIGEYLGRSIRERVVSDGNLFEVLNTGIRFTLDELKTELQKNPASFSPNVILRPLYQEVVLPNLAYIGGPGEISYWLELKQMFELNKVDFPVLHLRNSFLLVGQKTHQKMESLGLHVSDFLKPEQEITRLFLERHSEEQFDLEHELEDLSRIYDSVLKKSEAIDQSVAGFTARGKNDAIDHLKKVEKKLRESVSKRSENDLRKISSIRGIFFPDGEFQERHDNFISYYSRFGPSFLDTIYQQTNPFAPGLLCLII